MGGEGKSNNTKQKEEREEKKRKDRSSETVFEGDAAGENGGDWRVLFGHRRRRRRGRLGEWTKRWMARAVVAVVVGVAIIIICTSEKNHREEEEEGRTAASKKTSDDGGDDDKPMDIIVLTSSTGYDILSGFTKSLKQRRRKMSWMNEEKETFLSSLLPSSKGSKSSSLEPPKPKTVALIEQELKVNFLENQLPTPELLVSVSQVFSVGKFPGFLLSKCELAHVESIERMTEDAVHRKILREYLRSFQRFGSSSTRACGARHVVNREQIERQKKKERKNE